MNEQNLNGIQDDPNGNPLIEKTAVTERYANTAIALHWLLALVILGNAGIGLYMTSLHFSLLRLKLFNWHKWAGMVFLMMSVFRLLWRITHRPPALSKQIIAAMPDWQHLIHKLTLCILYSLFFIMPLTGWAYSSAAGFSIVLFGLLPLPNFVQVDPILAAQLKQLHAFSAYSLLAVAVLHIAAAIKHQWIDGDDLIGRILHKRGALQSLNTSGDTHEH